MSSIEHAQAELGDKLKRFQFERVLSHGTVHPFIYLLGKIDDAPAIIHLQKVAFDIPLNETDVGLVANLDRVASLQKNDIYEWAQGWYGPDRAADVKINMFYPCTDVHIRKYSTQSKYMMNETPEIYEEVVLPYIASFPSSRLQWLYNILDHKKEQDHVLYEDPDPDTGFMILPDMKWDGKTMSALYLSVIVHTREIKSLRDLRPAHLELLRKIKMSGEKVLDEKYGLKRGAARFFIHYQPSYYHFHVHIVSLSNEGLSGADVGKAHLMDDVISLLELSNQTPHSRSLLQEMTFTYHLGEQDGLYKALVAAGYQPGQSDVKSTQSSASPTPNKALTSDADLPICTACGTQFESQRDDCPICEDDRQFVPAKGQSWSSLRRLAAEGYKNEIIPDVDDPRISFIKTVPSFGIGQTPILLETSEGSWIWDCSAFLSESLITHLRNLKGPLKGIVISHPHFYATSTTWAKALGVPIIICGRDRQWLQRADQPGDNGIVYFDEERSLSSCLKVIRCGGHFEGSSILHWDRKREDGTRKGIIFCSDTAMVQPTQKGFTFQYSVPNMIPMNPYDVAALYTKIRPLQFSQATSTWPGRFIREEADQALAQSVRRHLEVMGCDWLWSSLESDSIQNTNNATKWSSADLLGPRNTAVASKQSLIVLNQPITRRDVLERLWRNCDFRICADGGANRLFDFLGDEERTSYLPDMIKGDLDSLRDDVKAYYANKGVEVIEDESEYTTDFQKCIEEVEKHHRGVKDPPVIVLGGLSGRLDQTTHVLSLLQKLRLRTTGSHGRDEDANTSAWRGSDFKVYMGDQLISHSKGQDLYDSQKRGKGTRDIKVVSENCVAWVLDKGEHIIDVDHAVYGQTCGVLPLGVESSHVQTKGLRWDFDWQTSFSTQISTSNHLDPEIQAVSIRTSRPVWWTMEIKDLEPLGPYISSRSFLIPLSVLRDEKFGFLTTMRFTHTGRAPSHHDIPLFELHMDRISRAFDHLGFTNGRTIGEMERKRDVARKEVAFQVTSFMSTLEPGDYRLRVLYSPDQRVSIQGVPMPIRSPRFRRYPEITGHLPVKIALDPESTHPGNVPESLYRIKTTERKMYTDALKRTQQTAESLGKPQPFDTILHWTDLRASSMEEDLVTETSFANIAIHVPDASAGPEWITPEECALAPFLPGLMREELLKSGILREGIVRVRDLRRWAKEGRRMIGMNGLRGCWEAQVIDM